MSDLIELFDQCFFESNGVRLMGGAEEPLYLPAGPDRDYHAIFFRRDYFRSALHEIAHWLIAGPARRLQVDYGYWYVPEGRNAQQQAAFEQMEAKPQALEWLLSDAAGIEFVVSLDNFDEGSNSTQRFEAEIHRARLRFLEHGLPGRAQRFFSVLCDFYGANLSIHTFRNQMFANGL